MNILLASAEVTPFAKAGGLADVAASLPREWQKYGQNPMVIMPKYADIDVDKYGFKPTDFILYVPMGNWLEFGRLWFGYLPDSNVPVYLVENRDYFDRKGIYGDPHEFWDNDRRFIFFSRAVFEASKALNFTPDIIHAHDFHSAFTMAFLKSHYTHDLRFARTAGVYTIHNLAYQGIFNPGRALHYAGFGMKELYPGSWFERFGSVNSMKTGIMFADKITTVSPTYAREIRWPYFSEGLQDVLNLRAADLVGILNGVYYTEWNPETDTSIYENYDASTLELKRANKHRFLLDSGISPSDDLDLPLVGMVSRLAEQKGIDILQYLLEDQLYNRNFRFALLGNGEPRYEDYFRYIKYKYPDRAIINIGYNNDLAHRVIAASDYFLLPSRYEPCGLTQMYALKYGTVPIVRLAGGLTDTVHEYVPATGVGEGFTFWQYNGDDFAYAIRRALSVYNIQPHWDLVRQNGMAQDYSAGRSALEYLKVFNWALEKVR